MEKVFVYLRLRYGETVLSRSKIREFGALGPLLPQFLRKTVEDGVVLPEVAADDATRPVLDYVDANTERVLISFRLDPAAQTLLARLQRATDQRSPCAPSSASTGTSPAPPCAARNAKAGCPAPRRLCTAPSPCARSPSTP